MTPQELEEIRKRVEGRCECKYDTPCNNCYFGYEEVRAILHHVDSLHRQIEQQKQNIGSVDLNKLRAFADEKGISLSINYWESYGGYEISTISPAKAEEFYMKRCSDDDYFIQKWEENLAKHKDQKDV